jgi:DNA-binding transcriptional LysR family regulator
MERSEPGWELYRSFLAVLREGSLSGAARALGLTQPTVGRHVDAIEASIGMALFVRTQQGLSPTKAALALRPYVEDMQSTSAALLRVASSQGEGVRGTVRITASDVITIEVLPPILAGLRAAYPELVIELVSSNRMEDLLQREADIAVRMVPPSQDVLVARRIGEIELGLYGHRSYLDREGTPASIDALSGHALIGYDKETAYIRAMKAHVPWMTRKHFALRTDSDLASLAALRAGFGIGFCQVGLARRDANLVRLFPDDVSLRLDTWLAMHQDLRDSPRCRVSFAALAEGLASYIDAGECR